MLIPRRSAKTDWEVELGVVIGTHGALPGLRRGRAAPASPDMRSATTSPSASSSWSAAAQWDKGKNCETFNPLGPWLVTADEVPAPQDLGLRLSVNGVQRQNGNTAQHGVRCRVPHLVFEPILVLNPGDLINTGTPAGVALGMAEPAYLRAGDEIKLEIDGLGSAAQRMGAA